MNYSITSFFIHNVIVKLKFELKLISFVKFMNRNRKFSQIKSRLFKLISFVKFKNRNNFKNK